MKPLRRIGILGGSFNPPHLGHVGICRYVLSRKRVDQVWVIPCFKHPFDKSLVPFQHRFRMCRLAFQKFGKKVRVLDIEKKMGGKSYTWRTIKYLQKKYPQYDFVLILGKDAAKEARTWHNYKRFRQILEWLVVPRGPKSPIPNISATEVRRAFERGKNLNHYLPRPVLDYVLKRCGYHSGHSSVSITTRKDFIKDGIRVCP